MATKAKGNRQQISIEGNVKLDLYKMMPHIRSKQQHSHIHLNFGCFFLTIAYVFFLVPLILYIFM